MKHLFVFIKNEKYIEEDSTRLSNRIFMHKSNLYFVFDIFGQNPNKRKKTTRNQFFDLKFLTQEFGSNLMIINILEKYMSFT